MCKAQVPMLWPQIQPCKASRQHLLPQACPARAARRQLGLGHGLFDPPNCTCLPFMLYSTNCPVTIRVTSWLHEYLEILRASLLISNKALCSMPILSLPILGFLVSCRLLFQNFSFRKTIVSDEHSTKMVFTFGKRAFLTERHAFFTDCQKGGCLLPSKMDSGTPGTPPPSPVCLIPTSGWWIIHWAP